jgi:hypothetical protein
VKIIINAEPEEIAEVVALIMDRKVMFDATPERLGWGWAFPIASGRRFFLRQIKGGISASPVKDPAP